MTVFPPLLHGFNFLSTSIHRLLPFCASFGLITGETSAETTEAPVGEIPAERVEESAVAADAAENTVSEEEATEPAATPAIETEADAVKEDPTVAVAEEDVAGAGKPLIPAIRLVLFGF